MAMVKAMTITVDSLLLRPKLDSDVGYDTIVKGASVVVVVLARRGRHTQTFLWVLTLHKLFLWGV